MENKFIKITNEKGQEMYLNMDCIATVKQASGNAMDTEIRLSSGDVITSTIQFHQFRALVGWDKKV